VPTGGEEPEEEEVGSLPDLHDGTESKGSSQEPEWEAVNEGPEDDLPGDLAIDRSWMLLPWQQECAPDAGRNMATGRVVVAAPAGSTTARITSRGCPTFMRCGGGSLWTLSNCTSSAARRQ
jgi:hypothetical protein